MVFTTFWWPLLINIVGKRRICGEIFAHLKCIYFALYSMISLICIHPTSLSIQVWFDMWLIVMFYLLVLFPCCHLQCDLSSFILNADFSSPCLSCNPYVFCILDLGSS